MYEAVAKGGLHVFEMICLQSLVLGIAFGLIFALLDMALDREILRRASYWVIILVRTIAHILATFVIIATTLLITHSLFGGDFDIIQYKDIWRESILSKTAIVLMIYTGVVSIIFNLLKQINSMFGPGILYNIISGRYHSPKEEERIFMFLDLKSSTTYAERLGHVLYSELIQDCFFDLTEAVNKHDAEIYQYVGDEAVLTWKISNGLSKGNCVEAFFRFEASIQRRADYYFNKYDLVPAFKAGMNMGMVMVAEVGVIKKEIAYHSDVLNTAARIQGKCNEYGKRLLITAQMKQYLEGLPGYEIDEVGTVSLKGKKTKITIFSLDKEELIEHPYEFSE